MGDGNPFSDPHSIQLGESQLHYSQYHQLQSRIGLNVTERGTFLFLLFYFLPHTLEFRWLRQPGAVSILNSGSVSPAGERICKTKHVFLLPAARGSLFPSEMGKRFPAHYVALKEFAIGYGSTWSFGCCSGLVGDGRRTRRRRNPADLSIICTGQVKNGSRN